MTPNKWIAIGIMLYSIVIVISTLKPGGMSKGESKERYFKMSEQFVPGVGPVLPQNSVAGNLVQISAALQAIPNAVATQVLFGSTEIDSGGDSLRAELALEGIRILESGIYIVQHEVSWVSVVGGTRRTTVLSNGAGGRPLEPSGIGTFQGSMVQFFELILGALITLEAFQSSGAPINLNGASLTIAGYSL